MSLSPAIIQRFNARSDVIAEYKHEGDETVAKCVADVLDKHYPGYLWAVNVNIRGGVIDILALQLSGNHGYTIKLVGLFSWDGLRDKVIEAGGELLERYNMPRGRFDPERWGALRKNIRGLPIGDLSR